MKEYGKIIKTIYILRYIDLLELRQAIQKQLNVVELSNRFSSAVSVSNGGEMFFLTHREQLISDACKNLIKSAITCWNYLFMTRHIQKIKDVKEKEELIKAISLVQPSLGDIFTLMVCTIFRTKNWLILLIYSPPKILT